MDKVVIRKLNKDEKIPYNLLLLADPSMEAIEEYITRGLCYIAHDSSDILGTYVLMKTRPFTLEIVNISVDEKYQGRGIGKKLLAHAINIARQEKAKVLEIGTGNSSIYQLALYQKCGFKITGIDKDFFRKHYEEKIIENGIECVDMIRLSMDLEGN